jgi:four helix bundle protein
MTVAKTVTELEVYKLAFELQQKVFEVSKAFPAEEKYSLIDQIRRSSRSIGSNICEAWRKRKYPAHFISKLSDSDGEAEETCHWLLTSVACEYLEREIGAALVEQFKHVGAMLNKMMNNADDWCQK